MAWLEMSVKDILTKFKNEDISIEEASSLIWSNVYPFNIDDLISFLDRTKDEKWCTDVVKTKDGKSCVLGHVFDWGGSHAWDWFEEAIATTYMIYPVNDGDDPEYKQQTPKERVIQYLKDVKDGKVLTTNQLMDECMKEYKKQQLEQ